MIVDVESVRRVRRGEVLRFARGFCDDDSL